MIPPIGEYELHGLRRCLWFAHMKQDKDSNAIKVQIVSENEVHIILEEKMKASPLSLTHHFCDVVLGLNIKASPVGTTLACEENGEKYYTAIVSMDGENFQKLRDMNARRMLHPL